MTVMSILMKPERIEIAYLVNVSQTHVQTSRTWFLPLYPMNVKRGIDFVSPLVEFSCVEIYTTTP